MEYQFRVLLDFVRTENASKITGFTETSHIGPIFGRTIRAFQLVPVQLGHSFTMKSALLSKGKKLAPAGRQFYVSSGDLSQHKCAVKTASRSALARDSSDHGAFAFIPPSAPMQVRHWPKI